jgi:hypothetical protein
MKNSEEFCFVRYVDSIFKVEAELATCLLINFLLGLSFDLEDRGDVFL